MPRRKHTPEERAAAKDKKRIDSKEWRTRNAIRIAEVASVWKRKNKELLRIKAAQWRAKNPERAKAIWRKHEAENVEHRRLLRKAWKTKNRESYLKKQSVYRAANKLKINEAIREWGLKNKPRRYAAWLRRFARLRNQLHPDHDLHKEKAIYDLSSHLTQTTGVVHHVDHIIPINAGGWHHHLNLQVLPNTVNVQKGHDPFWRKDGYLCWMDVPRFLWPKGLVEEYTIREASALIDATKTAKREQHTLEPSLP